MTHSFISAICSKRTFTANNTTLFIALSCVASVLWFAVQPVQSEWCQTDLSLTYTIPFICAIGGCMLMLRNYSLLISRLDVILMAWYLYVLWRAYIDTFYPCATIILRATQMMVLYVVLRILMSSSSIQETYIVFLILCFALYEALSGISQFVHGQSRHYLYLLTGSFQNPGPYSAILAMGLVMAFYWRKKLTPNFRLLASLLYIPIIVLVIVLPATWSRAALLSTAICMGIIYWNEWKRWFGWVIVMVVTVGVWLYHIKMGSADGRSVIYLVSILNIVRHPVFGSGIGSFFHQYAEEMSQFSQANPDFNFQSADVLDYAFNDLLRIGVEQGLAGIGFAITVIVFVLRSLQRRGQILRMGLLTLLIFSLFSYPFELLPYQLIIVTIFAYAGTKDYLRIPQKLKKQIIWRYFIPVCSMLLIIPVTIFVSKQIGKREKAESDYRMMAGIYDAVFTNDYYELLPLLRENPRFLFDFSKMLTMQGRYNDSNAMLRQGTLVSSDPMFYIIQGNNYKAMEAYNEAETAYLKAFHALPNRLYPLYQLMCLYKQTGELKKMRQVAQQVIDFNVKVESSATNEMKSNAKDLLNQRR